MLPQVAYFYDEEIGNYSFGGGNPMRPHRARMVYSLLNSYGVTRNLLVHRPQPRNFEQLTEYHADGELCRQPLRVCWQCVLVGAKRRCVRARVCAQRASVPVHAIGLCSARKQQPKKCVCVGCCE